MSYYPPFLKGTSFIENGLISISNSNTLGNLYTTGGNVGINTTSPNFTLDINGTLNTTSATLGTLNLTSTKIALGNNAGNISQGANAIAIGNNAGQNSQHTNSIILNASSNALNSGTAGAFYVNPVRNVTQANIMGYDTTAKELTYFSLSNLTTTNLVSTSVSSGSFVGSLVSASSVNAPGATIGTINVVNMTVSSYISTPTIYVGGSWITGNYIRTVLMSANSTITDSATIVITMVNHIW